MSSIRKFLTHSGKKAFSTTGLESHGIRGTIPNMGEGVAVGQVAEVERIFRAQDVAQFGALVHDNNILHSSMKWNDALENMPHLKSHQDSGLIQLKEDGEMTKILVHGMLVSSIFSSIFASLVPGCVYMNQTLNFSSPVYVDDIVLGRVEIEKVRKWRKGGVVVQCHTQVIVSPSEAIAIKGIANVLLPSGYALDEK